MVPKLVQTPPETIPKRPQKPPNLPTWRGWQVWRLLGPLCDGFRRRLDQFGDQPWSKIQPIPARDFHITPNRQSQRQVLHRCYKESGLQGRISTGSKTTAKGLRIGLHWSTNGSCRTCIGLQTGLCEAYIVSRIYKYRGSEGQ